MQRIDARLRPVQIRSRLIGVSCVERPISGNESRANRLLLVHAWTGFLRVHPVLVAGARLRDLQKHDKVGSHLTRRGFGTNRFFLSLLHFLPGNAEFLLDHDFDLVGVLFHISVAHLRQLLIAVEERCSFL